MNQMPRIFIAILIVSLAICVQGQEIEGPAKQGISNITGTGARALGMGGAFIAVADDATAASWNPAGLAILSRPEFSIVYDSVQSDTTFDYERFWDFSSFGITFLDQDLNDVASSDDSRISFISATYPFSIAGRPVVSQVSYQQLASIPGFDNPYSIEVLANDTMTGDSFSNRYDYFFGVTGGGDIDSYAVSVALPLTSALNAGLTINYVDGGVSVTENFAFDSRSRAAAVADARTDWSFTGWNVDLGLQYNIRDRVFLGAVYHSGFTDEIDSRFWFSDPNEPGTLIPRPSFTGDFEWPSGWGVGVALRPRERLTLSADYAETNWSDATAQVCSDRDLCVGAFPTFSLSRNFDTSAIRFGAEYVLRARNNVLIPVRAGYFEEEQLANYWGQSNGQPTHDGYSLGIGLAFGSVQFDVAYVSTTGTDKGSVGDVFDLGNGDNVTVRKEAIDVDTKRFVASMIYRF